MISYYSRLDSESDIDQIGIKIHSFKSLTNDKHYNELSDHSQTELAEVERTKQSRVQFGKTFHPASF